MGQKKSYHHGDLLQALIDAALDLVAEKDASDVSLREIARRVGVSHTAPYRHFADKEALWAAVAREGFERFQQELETAMLSASDPLEQLERGCASYLSYAAKHPARYRIMFGAHGANAEKADAAMAEAAKQTYLPFAGAIARGQEEGQFRAGDCEGMAQTLWALMHGLALLAIGGQLEAKEGTSESLSDLMLHQFMAGLASV